MLCWTLGIQNELRPGPAREMLRPVWWGALTGERMRTLWVTSAMIDRNMGRLRHSGESDSFYPRVMKVSAEERAIKKLLGRSVDGCCPVSGQRREPGLGSGLSKIKPEVFPEGFHLMPRRWESLKQQRVAWPCSRRTAQAAVWRIVRSFGANPVGIS